MIVADHLHKRFEDGFVAVKDAHFAIQPGEVFALLGPNGAGKSTAVHMMLGHVTPSSGRALIAGIDVHDRPLEAKRHLAYVSENVLLYGALTARQNLDFFCRISGADVPSARQAEVLDMVGLAAAARKPVESFSKGMRQRLGIAIALAKDPPAFIMDEPATGLDPVGTQELLRLTAALRARGKAILLVTHDLYHLRGLADRVAVLRDGILEAPVPAADIGDLEAFYRGHLSVDASPPTPAGTTEVIGHGRATRP